MLQVLLSNTCVGMRCNDGLAYLGLEVGQKVRRQVLAASRALQVVALLNLTAHPGLEETVLKQHHYSGCLNLHT